MRVANLAAIALLAVLVGGCTVKGDVHEVGSSPEPTFPQDERVLRDKLTTFEFGLSGPVSIVKRSCAELKAFNTQVGSQTEAANTKAGLTPVVRQKLNEAASTCPSDPAKAASLLRTLTGSRP